MELNKKSIMIGSFNFFKSCMWQSYSILIGGKWSLKNYHVMPKLRQLIQKGDQSWLIIKREHCIDFENKYVLYST